MTSLRFSKPPIAMLLVVLFQVSTLAQIKVPQVEVKGGPASPQANVRLPEPRKPGAEAPKTGVLPCPYFPPTIQWIPRTLVDPPAWDRFAGDVNGLKQVVEILQLGDNLVAQATALLNESTAIKEEDAALVEKLRQLHSTWEDLIRTANSLGPQICSHNAEVERYNAQCAGRELPEPEFQRCKTWQSQLNTRQAALESQRLAYNQRAAESEANLSRLNQQQQALQVRITQLDDKTKAFVGATVDAARKRQPTGGYEIDSSSFIQLAEKEPGWEKVQALLTSNRGRVFISAAAQGEVLDTPDHTRNLQRQALLQQWAIRKAEEDVPPGLVELFLNLGVQSTRSAGDAQIAASAWWHRRILITGNPRDFAKVVCPNFPCLVIEITKGSLAPLAELLPGEHCHFLSASADAYWQLGKRNLSMYVLHREPVLSIYCVESQSVQSSTGSTFRLL